MRNRGSGGTGRVGATASGADGAAARLPARAATRLRPFCPSTPWAGGAGRVADEMLENAKMVFDEAVDVAQEHPGIIGGTIAALVLWFMRNPIIGWLDDTLGSRR